jgi:hypothetical protein
MKESDYTTISIRMKNEDSETINGLCEMMDCGRSEMLRIVLGYYLENLSTIMNGRIENIDNFCSQEKNKLIKKIGIYNALTPKGNHV